MAGGKSMRILVISTCKERLSEEEFVRPLLEIALSFGKTEASGKYIPGFDRYIIPGTALMDFSYLERLEDFRGLASEASPILGICAGYQILMELDGIEYMEKLMIGKRPVSFGERMEEAYFLSSRIHDSSGWETLGKSDGIPVMVKKGNMLATVFHPEVMNRWIIEEFLEKGLEGIG